MKIYINKIGKAGIVVGLCGIVLTFLAAGLTDGGEVSDGVINGLLVCAMAAFLLFFIGIVIIKREEADEVIIPQEDEEPVNACPYGELHREFIFTNDLYEKTEGAKKDED